MFGYKGKQVRDNIHSYDVSRFIEECIAAPKKAEVYNLGGGKANSISILEAFRLIESISGIPMSYEYVEANSAGDHICNISDLSKIKSHYPKWDINKGLEDDLHGDIRGVADTNAVILKRLMFPAANREQRLNSQHSKSPESISFLKDET